MQREDCERRLAVLDLGLTFLAAVKRDAAALAIVDGSLRLSYAQCYQRISALVASFAELGLAPGDHLVTLLQNRWQAATLHWACQFAGVVLTPINWRAKPDELDFCLEDCEARALIYE
jgi:2-furoate---CoA ligase